MKAVLDEAGMTFENIVKTTIFIMDMNDFCKINSVYATYFNENRSSSETVQAVCLPKKVNVEIYDCNL
jgi:2-iminobutanoate/2-iminopropanoate deaminase